MKILQVPYCFYPDAVGGTEIYVEKLAKSLQDRGVDIVISLSGKSETYFHNGLKVIRYGSSPVNELSELYGGAAGKISRNNRKTYPAVIPAKAGIHCHTLDPRLRGDDKSVERMLDREKPDLIHLHAFTSRVSLSILREAKKRKIPAIFTYHTPAVSCQRGTLMRWGKEPCGGKINPSLCVGCFLHGLGLPKSMAKLFGLIPKGMNNLLGKARLSGGIWTAMRMHGLMSIRQATFRAFMDEIDKIVVLCDWTREALLRNGIPDRKITLIRQGTPVQPPRLNKKKVYLKTAEVGQVAGQVLPLQVVYIGRLDPPKGVDMLIHAFKSLAPGSIKLDIYGVVQNESQKKYLEKLKMLAGKNSRVTFKKPVPDDQVTPLLKKYDMLAVPSLCMETGPLAALEAFAAGIPVIGSNLGGIAELLKDGVKGTLVKAGDVKAWSKALERCSNDKVFLRKLRSGVQKPKTMDDVAEEMKRLYVSA